MTVRFKVDDLLQMEDWEKHREEMPQECLDAIEKHGERIGLGRNDELGWFIVGASNQGLVIYWKEKD